VQTAEGFQREALANYQQVIFNAFRETNDALVGTVKKREEATAQIRRVAALREYARLSRLRFDNGYAAYLEVLYAENELFGAELNSVRSQADSYTQLVNVYRAVGGGWVTAADKLAPQPQLRPAAATQ
jgi:multidrug efflux system outer membrane protein